MSTVVIVGPVSWNRIVYLDTLPEPRPHMRFAQEHYETLGGTSAGKALNLAGLGHDVELHTLIGEDADGERIRRLLSAAEVTVNAQRSEATERHLNLMTRAGERVSIYLDTASDAGSAAAAAPDFDAADVIVLDLGEGARAHLAAATAASAPVWIDLHDYDGVSEYHAAFVEAADVVFLNADGVDEPHPLMRSLIAGGASLAVCTLGAEGAIALDAAGEWYSTPAVPVQVRDTNGAGDAFMAGFLDAYVRGESVDECLRSGARQAAAALTTRHLHPVLDDELGA